MVHMYDGYATFFLAGVHAAPVPRGLRSCKRSTSQHRGSCSKPHTHPLWYLRADHAEKDSKGPQSDSPTSDAYAPSANNATAFFTLRWEGGWVVRPGASCSSRAACSTTSPCVLPRPDPYRLPCTPLLPLHCRAACATCSAVNSSPTFLGWRRCQ